MSYGNYSAASEFDYEYIGLQTFIFKQHNALDPQNYINAYFKTDKTKSKLALQFVFL